MNGHSATAPAFVAAATKMSMTVMVAVATANLSPMVAATAATVVGPALLTAAAVMCPTLLTAVTALKATGTSVVSAVSFGEAVAAHAVAPAMVHHMTMSRIGVVVAGGLSTGCPA